MTNLTQAPREEPSSDSMDPEDDPEPGGVGAAAAAPASHFSAASPPAGVGAGAGGALGSGPKLRLHASPAAKSGRLSPGLGEGEPGPCLAGWLLPPESPTIRAVTWGGGGASGAQHSAAAATVALAYAAQVGASPTGPAPAARLGPASPPRGAFLPGGGGLPRRDRSPPGPALAPPAATCYGEWRHANRGAVGLTSHLTKEVVALREELDRKMIQTESLAAKVRAGVVGLLGCGWWLVGGGSWGPAGRAGPNQPGPQSITAHHFVAAPFSVSSLTWSAPTTLIAHHTPHWY